jgi:hypothetical protein
MSRDDAIEVIRARGDDTPHDDIRRFCDFLRIDHDRFTRVVESFRNKAIWRRDNGVWKMDDFLIPDWRWA